MDECGFSPSQPNYSWTVSGERKRIPYENPQRRRINVMAAMIVHGNSGALVRSKKSSGSFTSEEFIEFLTQTFEPVAGLKVVVMDNYSIHRSKVVKAACRRLRSKGIILYYLPPYSPELNDIEGVFGAIKHHDMPERAYRSLDELEDAIDSAFDSAERRLKSRCAHSLRPGA